VVSLSPVISFASSNRRRDPCGMKLRWLVSLGASCVVGVAVVTGESDADFLIVFGV